MLYAISINHDVHSSIFKWMEFFGMDITMHISWILQPTPDAAEEAAIGLEAKLAHVKLGKVEFRLALSKFKLSAWEWGPQHEFPLSLIPFSLSYVKNLNKRWNFFSFSDTTCVLLVKKAVLRALSSKSFSALSWFTETSSSRYSEPIGCRSANVFPSAVCT